MCTLRHVNTLAACSHKLNIAPLSWPDGLFSLWESIQPVKKGTYRFSFAYVHINPLILKLGEEKSESPFPTSEVLAKKTLVGEVFIQKVLFQETSCNK